MTMGSQETNSTDSNGTICVPLAPPTLPQPLPQIRGPVLQPQNLLDELILNEARYHNRPLTLPFPQMGDAPHI